MGPPARSDPRREPVVDHAATGADQKRFVREACTVPKDSVATKQKLLDAAQHLFATVGIHTVASKDIVARADQKNVSALQYHFGGREGLLFAIIERHNAEIESERGHLLDQLESTGSVDLEALVRSVIVPFARKLGSAKGREFLLIVAQLGERFDHWDVGAPETPAQAQRALLAIAGQLVDESLRLSPEVCHERITRFLAMVSEALGSRARVHSRRPSALTHDQFVANLIDMSIGALTARASV